MSESVVSYIHETFRPQIDACAAPSTKIADRFRVEILRDPQSRRVWTVSVAAGYWACSVAAEDRTALGGHGHGGKTRRTDWKGGLCNDPAARVTPDVTLPTARRWAVPAPTPPYFTAKFRTRGWNSSSPVRNPPTTTRMKTVNSIQDRCGGGGGVLTLAVTAPRGRRPFHVASIARCTG